MSRFPRRAALAVVLATSSVPALAACGAGLDAITARPFAPGDGINREVGDLRVLNALVIAPREGSTDATVSLVVANNGTAPDAVVGMESSAGPVQLSGQTEIPTGGSLGFAGPNAQGVAVIRNFTGKTSDVVELRIRFQRGAPIDNPPIRTLVKAPEGIYAPFGATPAASPPPGPAGSPPAQPTAPAGTGGATGTPEEPQPTSTAG